MSMPSHLPLLRLVLPAHDASGPLSWFGFDAAGGFVAQGVASLAALPPHEELEIVLPARRVAAHHLSLPERAGKHLEAMISQALEDRILGDKTDILSIPEAADGTQRRVWVCSRSWLDGQLDRLSAAGLRIQRAFSEYALLPRSSGASCYAPTLDGFVFCTRDGRSGLVDAETLIPALTEDSDAQRVDELYRQPCRQGCVDFVHDKMGGKHAVVSLPLALSNLRRVGLLLVATALLVLTQQLLDWRQLEAREERLQNEIRQTFATRFPGTPIIDPLLQWESKQRELNTRRSSDALDGVLTLAARINAPIRPRRIESRDELVGLILTEAEFSQFRLQLERAGKFESSPAEAGLIRLQYLPTKSIVQ